MRHPVIELTPANKALTDRIWAHVKRSPDLTDESCLAVYRNGVSTTTAVLNLLLDTARADEAERLNRELAERDFVLALLAACLEQAWIETSRVELRLGNALARATLELREMGSLGE